jgi:hypothetical protein
MFQRFNDSKRRMWKFLKKNTTKTSPHHHHHHMSLMDFAVSPPGCGRSVTDFWRWDAHEAQLRCPDEVDGDIWIWSTSRGLKPKFY